MEAKDLSFFNKEMQPSHLHMFDKPSPKQKKYQVQNVATNVEALFYRQIWYTLHIVSYTNLHILWLSSALQETDMVLLHWTKLSKVWKIIHYKSIHNPLNICFPIAFWNRHGLMEGWAPISNQENTLHNKMTMICMLFLNLEFFHSIDSNLALKCPSDYRPFIIVKKSVESFFYFSHFGLTFDMRFLEVVHMIKHLFFITGYTFIFKDEYFSILMIHFLCNPFNHI